jgi:hypothetical protein
MGEVPMTALIELGDAWSVRDDAVAPRRWFTGRTRAGIVIVAALALLGGAAAPTTPPLSVVAEIASSTPSAMLLTASDLFIGEVDGTLTDYQVPSGGRRWRMTLGYPVGELSVDTSAQVLLVKAPDTAPQIGQVSAFDTGRGEPLWSADRSTIIDNQPGHLLVERQGFAIVPQLKWIDARTGSALWSRTIAAGADVSAGGSPTRTTLVTQSNGNASLFDEFTGAQLVGGDLGSLVSNLVLTPGPPSADAPPASGTDPLVVSGDAVLVQARRGATPGSLTAYDAGTLARRWVVTGDLLGVPFRCGRNVCVGSINGLRAVDPATGETRWRTEQWQYASPLDSNRLVAYSVSARGPLNPLGVATRANTRGQSTGVIDATTGKTLYDFGGDQVRIVANDAGPALLARAAKSGDYDIYRLYEDERGDQLLGDVTGVDPRFCLAAADLLACVTHKDSVRVWRITPD